VHNHPSGDATPSDADIAVTKEIAKAAAVLDIAVHDHLIIGRGWHTSLRELGILASNAETTGAKLGASEFPRHSAFHDEEPKG
jgi:hypothetical protein